MTRFLTYDLSSHGDHLLHLAHDPTPDAYNEVCSEHGGSDRSTLTYDVQNVPLKHTTTKNHQGKGSEKRFKYLEETSGKEFSVEETREETHRRRPFTAERIDTPHAEISEGHRKAVPNQLPQRSYENSELELCRGLHDLGTAKKLVKSFCLF